MANYKLILEDDYDEGFGLIAIHCGAEDFKMAYLCNRFLGLRLRRSKADLDFSEDGLVVTFPWFEYDSPQDFMSYDLLQNSCKTLKARTFASDGLFGSTAVEQTTAYLVPELRKVDYLLKVSSDDEAPPLKELLTQIKDIPEVVSAYEVDAQNLKSRNNLIFD